MQHGKKVVVLIGGAFVKDPVSGAFRTQTLEENQFGIIGDQLRGFAANVVLDQDSIHTTLMILGGITPLHGTVPDAPTLTEVLAQESRVMGILPEVIDLIEMHPKGGTYNQLLYLQEALTQQPQIETVYVITNDWQMERVKAMARHAPGLDGLNDTKVLVRFLTAEEILKAHDTERWWGPIAKAYRSESMKQTQLRELQGARQVLDGTYKYPTALPDR